MDTNRRELEDLCRSLWLRGALDKPEEFVRVRDALLKRCYQHVGRMELRELHSLTQAVHWVGPRCSEEPYVSMYEQAIGKLGVLGAYAASQFREFETAYRQLTALRTMLDASARRREHLGLVPWPHSEIKLNIIRVLADCKVQGKAEHRDRLYTPENLQEHYELLYSRYTAFMEEHGISGEAARVNWDNLAQTGSQVLKMSARFVPQSLIGQIQRFNRRFGANIAMGVGHFRDHRPLGGVWYWDFEITKLQLAGELTKEELDFCHERLLSAAKAEDPEAKIFHQALKTEYYWLAKAIQRRDKPGLEVLSG